MCSEIVIFSIIGFAVCLLIIIFFIVVDIDPFWKMILCFLVLSVFAVPSTIGMVKMEKSYQIKEYDIASMTEKTFTLIDRSEYKCDYYYFMKDDEISRVNKYTVKLVKTESETPSLWHIKEKWQNSYYVLYVPEDVVIEIR